MKWRHIREGELYTAPCEGGFVGREAEADGIVIDGMGFITVAELEAAILGSHLQVVEGCDCGKRTNGVPPVMPPWNDDDIP